MSSSRIVIAGGGSGGHIFPALAIAEGFVEAGWAKNSITFFGSGRTLEKDIVPQQGYTLVTFTGRGLNRGDFFRNIINGCGLIVACIKAFFLLLAHRPCIVIGVGGYASLPALFAATLLGINRVVHEQNAYVGRTNRLAQKFGAHVLTTFETTVGSSSKCFHGGMPMMPLIDDAMSARTMFQASKQKRHSVLVAGGSLGSVAINNAVVELVQTYGDKMNFDLTHICGTAHLENVQQQYKDIDALDKITLYPFRDDVVSAYAHNDCVVSRAGAGTCIELETLGVDCVLIPLPSAPGDHQRLNAATLVHEGLCVLLDQNELTAETLYHQVNATLKKAGQHKPTAYHAQARRRIVDYLIETYSLAC